VEGGEFTIDHVPPWGAYCWGRGAAIHPWPMMPPEPLCPCYCPLILQFYNRYNPSLPGPGTPLPGPCGVYSVRTSCLLRGADGTVAPDGPTDMPFALPPLRTMPVQPQNTLSRCPRLFLDTVPRHTPGRFSRGRPCAWRKSRGGDCSGFG